MSEETSKALARPAGASCPSCNEPLTELDLEHAGTIAGCARCGGLWLDQAGFATLMSNRLPVAATMFLDRITRSRKKPGAPIYRSAGAHGGCPICRGALAKIRVEETTIRGVRCAEHGSFFESAQAIRLMALASADAAARETALDTHPAADAKASGVLGTVLPYGLVAMVVLAILRACH